MKTCMKCLREKPGEEFHRYQKSPDGLQRWCKACFRARRVEKLHAEGGRTWEESRKARAEMTSKTCWACELEKPLEEFPLNRSRIEGRGDECTPCACALALERHHRLKNDLEFQAKSLAYREANREQFRRKQRERYASDPKWRQRVRDNSKAYNEANPDARRHNNAKRRALKKSAAHEPWNVDQVRKKTAGQCGLCRAPIDQSLKYPDPMSFSVDHIMPLSKGGADALHNLQAAHLICNIRKGNRTAGQEAS